MGAIISCSDGGDCCAERDGHRPQRVLLHQKTSDKTVKESKERWKDMYASGGNNLHNAAVNGNQKEVEELVRAGYSVESLDSKGRTPFFMACRYNKLNTARRLVELGANPHVVDNKQNEPTEGLSEKSAVKTWYATMKKTGKIGDVNQYFKHGGSFSQKPREDSHHGQEEQSSHGPDATTQPDGAPVQHKKELLGDRIKKDMFSVMDIDVHFTEDTARANVNRLGSDVGSFGSRPASAAVQGSFKAR